jgi:hypothetical protein
MVQVLLKSVRLLFPSADKADSGQSPKAGGEPQAGAAFVHGTDFREASRQ